MTNDALARALQQIDSEPDYVVDLAREMVRIPTVNPKFVADAEVNREPRHQEFLRGVLDENGFETATSEVFPDRPNLTGSWAGSDERSMVINGHVDVVPEGDRRQWSHDPFGGELEDGRLYGRGALDMKGGLAAGIAAARAIRKAGVALEGRFDIHAVVDEEAGGFGSRAIVDGGYRAAAALIPEPTWEVINPAEGGIEWARVTIRGKAGHAGWRYNGIYPQPEPMVREPAVNAIDLGVRFLAAVRELERDWALRKKHPLLPPGITTINAGAIIAGAGLGADGLPITTSNPAIVPDVFVVDFDIKFLPSEDPAEVRREFEAFVNAFAQTSDWLRQTPPAIKWELGGLHFPGQETPVDHPLVRSIIQARRDMGEETGIEGFVAVSDAGHYGGAGIPSALYGPSGDGMHGVDEFVEVESLQKTVEVIAAAIIDCGGVREG